MDRMDGMGRRGGGRRGEAVGTWGRTAAGDFLGFLSAYPVHPVNPVQNISETHPVVRAGVGGGVAGVDGLRGGRESARVSTTGNPRERQRNRIQEPSTHRFMADKVLRVGMVGYNFMGKAHSNAWPR